MSEVLLFHHAHGLTPGIREFAETLRNAGHRVHLPDLYTGRVFDDLVQGMAHVEEIGVDTLVKRGNEAAQGLPAELVLAGFSLGVLPAQYLAQTRPGARGALLFHACVPFTEFGSAWPHGLRGQIHAMGNDQFFVETGDLAAANDLVTTADMELFLYPGEKHLFVDSSLPSYEADAAALLTERVLSFLDEIG